MAVLGPNGAGKSTLMNTISGLIAPRAGRITFRGKRIEGLPAHRTVGEGLAHVLERRRLFPFLSVLDNVLLGAHNPVGAPAPRREPGARGGALPGDREPARPARPTRSRAASSRWWRSRAGSWRGPRLLMIDEPFLGLAPRVVEELGGLMRRIRDEQGIGIVFIEQNVELALRLADRGYILESGRTILSGPSAALLQSAEVKRIFLGDVAL